MTQMKLWHQTVSGLTRWEVNELLLFFMGENLIMSTTVLTNSITTRISEQVENILHSVLLFILDFVTCHTIDNEFKINTVTHVVVLFPYILVP